MKNKRSKEEIYFSWYLSELEKEGYIYNIRHEPKSIKLTDGFSVEYIKKMKRVPDKILTKTIIPTKVYTYDFDFYCTDYFLNNKTLMKYFRTNTMASGREKCFVEVKGSFDMNNMTRLFKQNQAWVYDKYKVYINLIKIPLIFKQTFTPNKYLLTDKTGKPRTINFKVKPITEL
jgi:hypothetical protein